ncbi:MAG TPA: putative nucleotide-diphospho-sugar transferase [Solirubrobacteraceae bacterium]|nr:putative nucleotide-diphospho-sugar transferase [Solirubrobacteraceae bacterium]
MRRRKAFCTLAFGSHLELLEIGRPAIEEYCERHGYDLVIQTERRTDLPASWEKVPLIRGLLDDYAEVMWMDADAVIVDSSEDIFDALSPDRSFGLVMHVNLSLLPNAGVLAVRSAPDSIALVDQVWELREQFRDHAWWEQGALVDALGFDTIGGLLRLVTPTRYMLAVEFLRSAWNSIPLEYVPNAKIKHYPATAHEHRVRSMCRDLQMSARRSVPPACAMSAVFVLHDSDSGQLATFVGALDVLATNSEVQIVLAAPTDPGFDVLSRVGQGVTVLRDDFPPDEALLDALTAADGRVLLLASGGVPITGQLCAALLQFANQHPDMALMRSTQLGDLLVFDRQRLPLAGWFTFPGQPRPPFAELQRSFAALGTPVVG